jgi:hypothetical protein
MPRRRSHYATVHPRRSARSVRSPLGPLARSVRLQREGAKFAAVGIDGGLLVLTVYEPAPEDRTSSRGASRSRVRHAGDLRARKPVYPARGILHAAIRAMQARHTALAASVVSALRARF